MRYQKCADSSVEKESSTPASIKRGMNKSDKSQHAHKGEIIVGVSKPKKPKR
jgi:hypothetical protein